MQYCLISFSLNKEDLIVKFITDLDNRIYSAKFSNIIKMAQSSLVLCYKNLVKNPQLIGKK